MNTQSTTTLYLHRTYVDGHDEHTVFLEIAQDGSYHSGAHIVRRATTLDHRDTLVCTDSRAFVLDGHPSYGEIESALAERGCSVVLSQRTTEAETRARIDRILERSERLLSKVRQIWVDASAEI